MSTRFVPIFCVVVFLFSPPVSESLSASASGDDWPNWMGPRHDGVWRENGIVRKLEGKPRYKWRVPVNKGYTGPAVVGDRLYFMDRVEAPQPEEDQNDDSGDKKDAKKEQGRKKGGFAFPSIPGTERILCLNAETGKEIWKYEYECTYQISYPEGPRTTPLVAGDRLFTLGAMGNLLCLDRRNGKVIWEVDLPKRYKTRPPVWGYAAHLRLYGDKLVTLAGGEGSAVVSLDPKDGSEIWKSGSMREVGYAPPVPLKTKMSTQLVYWGDEAIVGLDLESGKQQWSVKFPEVPVQRPVVTIMTPQVSGRRVMVSNFYNGSCVIEVAEDGTAAKKVWSADPQDRNHKTGLNILMGTPWIKDGAVYGFAGKGEMRCVDLDTGKQLWEEKSPANAGRASYFATAFITPNQDRYFIFNDQGELVVANFDRENYKELSRTKILEPSTFVRGRNIVWSHPAYANRCLFVRNSKELVCVDLSEGE